MNEKNAAVCLWLNSCTGYGMSTVKKFLRNFSNPFEGYDAAINDGLPKDIFTEKERKLLFSRRLSDFYGDIEWCKRQNVDVVTFYDENYPFTVRRSKQPFALLFAKGNVNFDYRIPTVAFAGSRDCSSDAERFCGKTAYELSECGVRVVSGITQGIESSALTGATDCKTSSPIAVLSCPIDKIYPCESEYLYNIIQKCGTIISPFAAGDSVPPMQGYNMCNTLTAELAYASVLVSAGRKSGSLSLIRAAEKNNRLVYAVPGSASDSRCEACNDLIKSGARVCTESSDIIRGLNEKYYAAFGNKIRLRPSPSAVPKSVEESRKRKIAVGSLSAEEKTVFDLLNNPRQTDELCQLTALPFPVVASVIQSLEMQGLIKQEPTGYTIVNN